MRLGLLLSAVVVFFVFVSSRIPTLVSADAPQAVSGTAVAQPAVPAAGASDVVPAQPAVAAASTSPNNALVSLDFQDSDIRNVLKVLSYKSGVNIVAGPEVTGVVTIQLTEVPWQRALEVILVTYGYSYERKGNIITVTTVENLKKRREDSQVLQEQEPLATKTYSLSFAKAADVVDSISKIKTSRGTINFDQRTNTLIVRDVQSGVDLIDGVVRTLDSVTPQVLIEAKVMETTLSDTDKLGIDWTLSGTASGAAHSTTFPFTDATTTFIPSGATVASNTFTYGTLNATGLSATLNVLKTRTDTNILSNPKIVTLDNQPAKVVVGTKYPFPQYTYNQEQAKMQVSGWEYKDIGIIFEVTPHVNNAGLVTLDLHPVITGIQSGSDGTVTVEGTTVPKLTVEETQTKVMIENGQTLVIAGLIKDTTSVTNKKVPFLGDIPLLGEFFKNKVNQKDKTELLIFLTPHIITVQQPPTTGTVTNPPAPAAPSGN